LPLNLQSLPGIGFTPIGNTRLQTHDVILKGRKMGYGLGWWVHARGMVPKGAFCCLMVMAGRRGKPRNLPAKSSVSPCFHTHSGFERVNWEHSTKLSYFLNANPRIYRTPFCSFFCFHTHSGFERKKNRFCEIQPAQSAVGSPSWARRRPAKNVLGAWQTTYLRPAGFRGLAAMGFQMGRSEGGGLAQ